MRELKRLRRELHEKCFEQVLDYQETAIKEKAFSLEDFRSPKDFKSIEETKTVSIYLWADNSEHVSFMDLLYNLSAITGKWTEDEGTRGVIFELGNIHGGDGVRAHVYEALTHDCINGKGMSYLEPEMYTLISLCRELETRDVERVIVQCGNW